MYYILLKSVKNSFSYILIITPEQFILYLVSNLPISFKYMCKNNFVIILIDIFILK